MPTIKILYQLNSLGYGGTEKAILAFCTHLDRAHFEPHLFFHTDVGSLRYYKKWILRHFSARQAASYRERYKTHFARLPAFREALGADALHIGGPAAFFETVDRLRPHIVHVNRGDETDFYTHGIHKLPAATKLVETNIFAKPAAQAYLDRVAKICFVSKWCMERAPWAIGKEYGLYNPINEPASSETLHAELGIPTTAHVLGRISRPNLDDGGIILDVWTRVQKNNRHLIILGASKAMRSAAAALQNVHCLPPTTDEERLSAFYNTLTLLLHYRAEGETFGMNIAEAMMHGKPVLSHRSQIDNAQYELLSGGYYGPIGYVFHRPYPDVYADTVKKLLADPAMLTEMGANAHRKAYELYRTKIVTEHLEKLYKELCR